MTKVKYCNKKILINKFFNMRLPEKTSGRTAGKTLAKDSLPL